MHNSRASGPPSPLRAEVDGSLEVRDDGQLNVELSQEPGQGLDTMNNFIREHITRILQPFGEHVDDLRRAVDQMRVDLMDTDERSSKNQQALELQTNLLNQFRSDLDSVTADGLQTRQSLEKSHVEQSTMWNRIHEIQAQLDANCELAVATDIAAKATHNSLTETGELVKQLSTNVAEANDQISHVKMETRDLVNRLGALDQRHEHTTSQVSQMQAFAVKTDADFQAYMKAYGMQKQKDDRRFQHVTASMADIGDMLKSTDEKVHKQEEHLKTTITMVRAMRAKLDRTADDLQAAGAFGKETADTLHGWIPHLENMKRSLFKMESALAGGNPDEEATIKAQVIRLMEALNKARSLLDTHDDMLRSLGGESDGSASRLSSAERAITGLTEQVLRLEEQVGIEKKESKEEHSNRICRTFMDVVKKNSLIEKQKKLTSDVQAHEEQLGQLETKLLGTLGDLDATKCELRQATEVLGGCMHKVGELTVAQDLTQEYWQGLSKGLRETHKSVALENSLLPPKSLARVTLPVIPRSDVQPVAPGGIRGPSARAPSRQQRIPR